MIVCSPPKDGLGCRLGVKPPLKLLTLTLKASVYWLFALTGDAFYFTTPPGDTYEHVYVHEERHYVEFELRTCSTASLYLGPRGRPPGTPAYEVLIAGGGEPGISTIRR